MEGTGGREGERQRERERHREREREREREGAGMILYCSIHTTIVYATS